jgi:hypothetical protein
MFVLVMDFIKHATEIGSCSMTYIPSFTETGSGIQKVLWGGGGIHIQTHTQTDLKVIS